LSFLYKLTTVLEDFGKKRQPLKSLHFMIVEDILELLL